MGREPALNGDLELGIVHRRRGRFRRVVSRVHVQERPGPVISSVPDHAQIVPDLGDTLDLTCRGRRFQPFKCRIHYSVQSHLAVADTDSNVVSIDIRIPVQRLPDQVFDLLILRERLPLDFNEVPHPGDAVDLHGFTSGRPFHAHIIHCS